MVQEWPTTSRSVSRAWVAGRLFDVCILIERLVDGCPVGGLISQATQKSHFYANFSPAQQRYFEENIFLLMKRRGGGFGSI